MGVLFGSQSASPRILLLSRKLLCTHIASRILLGFGLATCVVADRILHASDLHMRASTCIASISCRVYLSMVFIEVVLDVGSRPLCHHALDSTF